MILYHGSNEIITEIRDEGIFGGLFFSSDRDAALSHGDKIHELELDENSILTQNDIDYHLDNNHISELLNSALSIPSNLFDDVYKIVMEDYSIFDLDNNEQELLEIFKSDDLGEASWEAQRIRAEVAKRLGYKAVEMNDEHGTSYLVFHGLNEIRAN
jgi:hypothetical protein